MGRYTLIPDADVEATLDRVLPEIGAEIGALKLPELRAAVLGGGYGRGEGGVLHTPEGGRLYNDLDFFVFSENAGPEERARIDGELKTVSARWEKELGVAVDFGPVKNLSSLSKVSRTLMYQELLRGWLPVWGEVELKDWLEELESDRVPYSEAARLLLNRGMGLIFAGEYLSQGKADADFIVRNMNKAVLGGGDSLLIAERKYSWKGLDRVRAYRDHVSVAGLPEEYAVMYEKAFHWKMEPETVLPSDPAGAWRKCRRFYLDSVCLCAGVGVGAEPRAVIAGLRKRSMCERSLKNALRWLVRGRSLRSAAAFFDPPVVSMLEKVYMLLAGNERYAVLPPSLYRLWTIFN